MENWKIIFRCPKIWANYSPIIMCSNTGTPNIHHFLFGTNGKVVVLGVPILKHFRVYQAESQLRLFRHAGWSFLFGKLTSTFYSAIVDSDNFGRNRFIYFFHLYTQKRRLICLIVIGHEYRFISLSIIIIFVTPHRSFVLIGIGL